MAGEAENQFDPASAIYTPSQVANYGLQAIERIKTNASRGITIPISSMMKYFAPVLPGQLCAVIAQTSHYKSGFLHYVEHEAARHLLEQGREDEILVHVSVEECVEEQAFLEFARQGGENAGSLAQGQVMDWDRLNESALKVGTIPIYRIGDSLARAEDMPYLHMSNMILAIKYLAEEFLDRKPKIAGLFFDYLQAFPIDPIVRAAGVDGQRRLQVRSDIYRLRQAAAYFNCPVFVAVQAKQHLDGAYKEIAIPGIYDGEESSSIAQRCDRVLTLWMPFKTIQPGETFYYRGKEISPREDMLWIKVAKQRGGYPSGAIFPCQINFATNHISLDEDTRKTIFGYNLNMA